MVQETDLGSIPGRVIPKTLKWFLKPCLTLSNISYVSRVKWSNPGKGVVPSPTPRCSSYWKGSLLVTLDYSRQIFLCLKKTKECICQNLPWTTKTKGFICPNISINVGDLSLNYRQCKLEEKHHQPILIDSLSPKPEIWCTQWESN